MDGMDRHWAGHGKVFLERDILPDYLAITGQRAIDPSRFEIVDIPKEYPLVRIHKLENQAKQ